MMSCFCTSVNLYGTAQRRIRFCAQNCPGAYESAVMDHAGRNMKTLGPASKTRNLTLKRCSLYRRRDLTESRYVGCSRGVADDPRAGSRCLLSHHYGWSVQAAVRSSTYDRPRGHTLMGCALLNLSD